MSTLNAISITVSALAILISATSVALSKASDWWLDEARRVRRGAPPREEPGWITFVRFIIRRPRGKS